MAIGITTRDDRAVISLFTRDRKLALTSEARLSSISTQMIIRAVHGRLATLVAYKGKKFSLEQVIQEQAYFLARSLRGQTRFRAFLCRY